MYMYMDSAVVQRHVQTTNSTRYISVMEKVSLLIMVERVLVGAVTGVTVLVGHQKQHNHGDNLWMAKYYID